MPPTGCASCGRSAIPRPTKTALDLVLFLNGLPVATAELKTDFTQSVEDAIDQYRFDRNPRPKGQNAEPLLSFPSGALVHFAVSNTEVLMTTRLEGPATSFLPFNRGDHGAAGNPPNPNGHPTSYLWEEVWERETLARNPWPLHRPREGHEEADREFIFPRYHQLDATRKLVAAVREEGAGGKYLIQHSAGSGKTNSIAWTAHFLADLHNAKDEKLFDDRHRRLRPQRDRRPVAGRALRLRAHARGGRHHQERRRQQERRVGRGAGGRQEDRRLHDPDVSLRSRCGARAGRDAGQAVCGHRRRGAFLADGRDGGEAEGGAHGGRTGGAGGRRRGQHGRHSGRADGGARASEKSITYVAFTATPKAKTLEIFGRRPNPDEPAGDRTTAGGVSCLFDAAGHRGRLHSRCPEELHALQARLPPRDNGKEWDEREVERDAALKGIMRWVRLHPYNISQKVADRRRALPRERRAAARRQGQGDGGARRAARRRSAGIWR